MITRTLRRRLKCFEQSGLTCTKRAPMIGCLTFIYAVEIDDMLTRRGAIAVGAVVMALSVSLVAQDRNQKPPNQPPKLSNAQRQSSPRSRRRSTPRPPSNAAQRSLADLGTAGSAEGAGREAVCAVHRDDQPVGDDGKTLTVCWRVVSQAAAAAARLQQRRTRKTPRTSRAARRLRLRRHEHVHGAVGREGRQSGSVDRLRSAPAPTTCMVVKEPSRRSRSAMRRRRRSHS